jgi:transposase
VEFPHGKRAADGRIMPTFVSIDMAEAPQKNSAWAIGRSRGGSSTKIPALVDAVGNPARRILPGGQTHAVTQTEPLLDGVQAENLVADKAYDSRTAIDAIHARHSWAVNPPRSSSRYPRESDPHVSIRLAISWNAFSIASDTFAAWQHAMTNSMVGIMRLSLPSRS